MSEDFKKLILKLLKSPDYKPLKSGKLVKSLGIDSEDYPGFKDTVKQMQKDGLLVETKGLLSLSDVSSRIVGTFRANPKGFGFVTPFEPHSHTDVYIPSRSVSGSMTGDIVAVKVKKTAARFGSKRYSGQVTEVLQRANNRFVGVLMKDGARWLVQPDGTGFEPICVDDITAKNASQKDKVVVEILSYPTEDYFARGVIVEVLGRAGKYDAEIKSVIYWHKLPDRFPDECLRQARDLSEAFDPDALDKGRLDITDKLVITIDPANSKDFDDAISLEKDPNGNSILGVHIADVSSFVKTGTALDGHAAESGNSVYLPAKTLAMLPEILSNGVCSLQAGQKRYCKSVFITYDEKGNILERHFSNTLICSGKRLTYVQAAGALKNKTKNIPSAVISLLKDMEALSRIIELRRRKNGMIHLDMPETELIFDKTGQVIDARAADDSYPHTIIEMFMVEANEAAASLLSGLKVPFIRRIHPDPDSLSMKNLAKLLKVMGIKLPKDPTQYDIQQLLDSVKGTDNSLAVSLLILRSFQKAEYAPSQIGHYALGSQKYCHFTSPIRRYADLLIHRLIDSYLKGALRSADIPDETELAEIGKHITFTEQRAGDAENELKTVLILQMLSKRIGETLDCVITGLTGFGVFVQCRKFGIAGLISTEDLGPDEWNYNTRTNCIIGTNSSKVVRLGQGLKVRIVSVNMSARQLKLCPEKPLVEKKYQKRGPKRSVRRDRSKRR